MTGMELSLRRCDHILLTEQRFRHANVRALHASIDDCAMGIFVYMLRCSDGSFYIGSATGDDLSPRIDQHNAGSYPGYTFTRRPVVLVWSEHFDRITDGIAAERQIKGWSRAKKEALIRSDWAAISRLAQRRGGLADTSKNHPSQKD